VNAPDAGRTVHLAGPEGVASLCGQPGVAVAQRRAFAPGSVHYSCPACRSALGGTEPMAGPAGAPAASTARRVATAGSWGWDVSSYDHARGPVSVDLAVRQGITLMTHKATEGTSYRDPYWAPTYQRMRASQLAAYGPYHVLYPAAMVSVTAQVNFLVGVLDSSAPGWRTDPRFVVQLDAERFDYMSGPPSVEECNQFRSLLIHARGGGDVIGYLPRWLYGDAAGAYGGPLWSSAYVSGAGSPAAIYPGDSGTGWQPYGGKAPLIWQFSSTATIAGQQPCDANAVRIGVGQLLAVLTGGIGVGDADNWALSYSQGAPQWTTAGGRKLTNEPVNWRVRDEAWQKAVTVTMAAQAAQITALSAALGKVLEAGGSADSAAVIAHIDQVAAAESAAVAALKDELDQLHAAQAAAAKAQADALGAQ
jgi:hypothetical protein